MDNIEISILKKRQRLKDLLDEAKRQNPTVLSLIRALRNDINFCDFMLFELYARRTKYKII